MPRAADPARAIAMTSAMKKRIPAKNARQALLAAWFGFFLVNLALLLWLYLDNWIFEDNFRAALSQLSALYAPYLGGILGYYFSARAKKPAETGDAGTAFFLAGLASAIWNFAILGILLRVVLLWG